MIRPATLFPAIFLPMAAQASSAGPAGIEASGFLRAALALYDALTRGAARAAAQLADLAAGFGGFPAEVGAFLARLSAGGFDLAATLTRVAIWLAVAALAEAAVRAVLARLRRGATGAGPAVAAGTQAGVLGGRWGWLAGNLVALAVFAGVGGWPLLMSVQGDPAGQSLVATYFAGLLGVRVFALLARFALAPWAPDLRLVALDDDAVRRLYLWAVGIAAAAIFFMLTTTLLRAGGLAPTAVLTFALLTRSLVAAGVIAGILANRRAVALVLAADRGGRRRSRGWAGFAATWHLLAVTYVLLSWFVSSMLLLLGRFEANSLAVLSFFALMGLVVLCLALDDWAARVDARAPEAADPRLRGMPSFARFFARLGQSCATVLCAVVLVRVWSGPWNLAVDPRIAAVLPAVTQLLITLFIANVLWQLVAIGSERMMIQAAPQAGGRRTRVATFLPLIRNVIFVAIAIVATMIGLSAVGVDVLPLLAGAGVVGIAIGMGSQALVKDIVSGIFFLLDDAFRVGDYVNTGLAEGTIERAGIRSLAIRHPLGALHTVPFGEIQTIANHSRDWVSLRLDFRVPFDTDTALLEREFEALGQQLLADPAVGPLFVGALEFGGVVMIDEGAMVVRASYRCLPGEQYRLRRLVYDAVQKMFRRNGISVAVREVRVRGEGAEARGGAAVADLPPVPAGPAASGAG